MLGSGGEASGNGVMPWGGFTTYLMPGLHKGEVGTVKDDLGPNTFFCSNNKTFLESQATPSHPRCNTQPL